MMQSSTGRPIGAAHQPSLKDERSLREEVAACTLLLNSLGILGYSGHVSARLTGRDALIVQPQDMSRAEVGPDDLLVCDFDGKVLAGTSGTKPPSEVYLHCEIYRARPDVMAVAHFHHDLANVFTLVDGVPLVPLKNHAVRWASGIPTHPDPSHVHSADHGRAVAATLGPHHAMQIRAHGQIITAESAPAVFVDSVHFVENAVATYQAAAIGKVLPLSGEEIAAFLRGMRREHHVSKLWKYYVRGAVRKGLIPATWELGH
jgi:L-ribulose-5-phosphate 4-epimerase